MLNNKEFEEFITEPKVIKLTDMIKIESYQPAVPVTPDELKMNVLIETGYSHSTRILASITKDLPATREELIKSVRDAIGEYADYIKNDMLKLFNKAV